MTQQYQSPLLPRRACSKTSWKKEGVDYLEKAIDLSIPKDSSMTRLYIGMTDCYKMAQMYKEQIASIKERYQGMTNKTTNYCMTWPIYTSMT